MAPDSATLHDLDVLSTSVPRGPTLVGLVDRTRSRAGREALRQRLVAPGESGAGIVALQRAHQVLAADGAAHRACFDRAGLDAAERYLTSNWQLPSARLALTRLVEALRRPAWFRDYLREVGDGQIRVLSLLGAAGDLSRALSATNADVLKDTAARIVALLSAPDAQALLELGTRRSATGRLAFDQLARS